MLITIYITTQIPYLNYGYYSKTMVHLWLPWFNYNNLFGFAFRKTIDTFCKEILHYLFITLIMHMYICVVLGS